MLLGEVGVVLRGVDAHDIVSEVATLDTMLPAEGSDDSDDCRLSPSVWGCTATTPCT